MTTLCISSRSGSESVARTQGFKDMTFKNGNRLGLIEAQTDLSESCSRRCACELVSKILSALVTP
jgi:hypothetical protein